MRARHWKSFHCKSCHSLHAPRLPPSAPSPPRFISPPTFMLTWTLFLSLSLRLLHSLVISLLKKKRNRFGSLPLSLLLFVSTSRFHFSPPASLSRSFTPRVGSRQRESSGSFLTHWLISARPSLGSIPTPTGDPRSGRNRKWAACGGDGSLEGLSGPAPSTLSAGPGPCQSATRGTQSSYYLRREGEWG